MDIILLISTLLKMCELIWEAMMDRVSPAFTSYSGIPLERGIYIIKLFFSFKIAPIFSIKEEKSTIPYGGTKESMIKTKPIHPVFFIFNRIGILPTVRIFS